MTDLNDLDEVREILEELGLTTAKVPEADTKRCDLRARDGEGMRYLIEVKGFHDDAAIATALRQDDDHVGARPLVRSNAVEKGTEYAIKQLQSTPMAAEALWLVALLNRTVYGADVTSQQILGTLYGIRSIVYVDSAGRRVSRNCLYFSHSEFHRHPELDGAIVIDQDGAGLLLNDFGRRVERVRESVLGRRFARRGALNDAATLESKKDFFWADCTLDRNDDRAVLEYVKGKYCLRWALATAPIELSAMVSVTHPRSKS